MNTPTVGLVFQTKVKSYYQLLGMPENAMEFDSYTTENVINHVLSGWNRRHEIREKLQKRIPELQIEARRAAEIVAALRKGEGIDRFFKRNPSTFQEVAASNGHPKGSHIHG